MQGSGDISYSLKKDSFYKVIASSAFSFIPVYWFIVLISLIFIYFIGFQRIDNKDIIYYFDSITYNSPFGMISCDTLMKNGYKYIGLKSISYILIVVVYVIALIILLKKSLENMVYSIYANSIQINPNNNPYNNENCIKKIDENPVGSVSSNYFTIVGYSLLFLLPFLIPTIIKIFDFDNYDIKHSSWFSYLILFFILSPLIFIGLISFGTNMNILDRLKYYIDSKDYSFVDDIKNNFNSKFYMMIPFLLIIFIYIYFVLVHINVKYDFKGMVIAYGLIILLLFIIIPLFLIYFNLDIVFNNGENKFDVDIDNGMGSDISINSIYKLLIKYNYPCFLK